MKIKLTIALLLFSLLCSLFVSCDNAIPAETTAPETQAPATDAPAETTVEVTTEEITTSAPETTEEEIKMPKTIRIGSYNFFSYDLLKLTDP